MQRSMGDEAIDELTVALDRVSVYTEAQVPGLLLLNPHSMVSVLYVHVHLFLILLSQLYYYNYFQF
jgi:hypothetical protein